MLKEIETFLLAQRMDVVGVADAAEWGSPVVECRPAEILKDCKRIIVFGKEISHPIYITQRHAHDLYGHIAQNYYQTMDAAAIEVASMLTRKGYPSVPLGAYLPLLMREGKYWGIVSLKHAAVRAGLGAMGRNTLLVNEKFGNRLRFGGILTSAPLPAGKPLEKSYCPDDCRTCADVCPVQALDGRGGINQYKCLRRSTSHPLLSTAFLSQWFRTSGFINNYFELVTGTLGARYSYGCCACLVNCPHFKKGISRSVAAKDE
ncbi:MAG: epoxyqueuosine reductase [Candidatus Abyssobacteria bacterium SURF_17]|jgi:epoxyqueuosine reductase QueG|uniref:Epoxyqueuosine reductase n=1 Tax=Candidatus Abyssobacteria bacterium SURF_17 TaxID=2093361 RepID=A0A419EW60_9BACT|nr:MAG: epoxyqueuosine reductase [Candidatus Abyssubacteria bacterium SURF_17]